jgi:hypothetical protein
MATTALFDNDETPPADGGETSVTASLQRSVLVRALLTLVHSGF